jgi:hypothetical protein
METEFTLNTIDLKKTMAEVRKLSRKSASGEVAISVQPDRIEMQFIGITRFLAATTTHFCDVIIPFSMLEGLAKTVDTKAITLQVTDGQLVYGQVNVHSKHIKIQSLFTNPESALPMNMTPKLLLGLRKKQSTEYLEKLGIMPYIEAEESKLEKKLQAAARSLKVYGITYEKLKNLVEQNNS